MQSHVGYLSICLIRSSRSFQSALKPNYIAVLLIGLRTRFFFFIPTGQAGFAPCEKLQIPESWELLRAESVKLKESGIPLTFGIRNPIFQVPRTRKRVTSTWNPESTGWNSESKTVGLRLIHG